MKVYMKFIHAYFRSLSVISPKVAGKQAAQLFQKVNAQTIRKKEQSLYEEARTFIVNHERENIPVYELGDKNGDLVFLLHGWNSSAGSMTAIAQQLANQGNRVITFDLPAHGKSKLTHTNLMKVSQAFHSVISQINPQKPFSIISHSFGSAVAIFTLSKSNFPLDKLILLSSPNKMESLFMEYAQTIGLNKRAYRVLLDEVSKIVKRPVEEVNMAALSKDLDYQSISMIYDRNDRVIPFTNARAFANELPDIQMFPLRGVGHYRMLWDEEVLDIIGEAFEPKTEFAKNYV